MVFVSVKQYKGKLDPSDLKVDDECLEKQISHSHLGDAHQYFDASFLGLP